MRGSSAIRVAAWGAVVLGAAAPLVRRRFGLTPPVVTAAAATAPFALAVAARRSAVRDVAVVCLQMNAYVANYEMPHDDPERQAARVKVRYPIVGDRILGLGELPGLRLQRAFARAEGEPLRAAEQVLVWCHWLWFIVPHGTVAYLRLRRALPTAPPWYAAQVGALGPSTPAMRRMMREHGEAFWKGAWTPLYDVLGGNPLAAMPSLHFATSVMAAHLLADAGPVQGALGWTYALTLGFALVYLGEHYVVDLLAGLALAEGVRRHGRRAAPALGAVSRAVQRLEARARA
jgi:PAP2 superfamily protein